MIVSPHSLHTSDQRIISDNLQDINKLGGCRPWSGRGKLDTKTATLSLCVHAALQQLVRLEICGELTE